jgi:hypothetical protein
VTVHATCTGYIQTQHLFMVIPRCVHTAVVIEPSVWNVSAIPRKAAMVPNLKNACAINEKMLQRLNNTVIIWGHKVVALVGFKQTILGMKGRHFNHKATDVTEVLFHKCLFKHTVYFVYCSLPEGKVKRDIFRYSDNLLLLINKFNQTWKSILLIYLLWAIYCKSNNFGVKNAT